MGKRLDERRAKLLLAATEALRALDVKHLVWIAEASIRHFRERCDDVENRMLRLRVRCDYSLPSVRPGYDAHEPEPSFEAELEALRRERVDYVLIVNAMEKTKDALIYFESVNFASRLREVFAGWSRNDD